MKKVKKMSTLDVASKADWEGLDYAIQHYFSGEEIEDPILAALWSEARVVLNKISTILEKAVEDSPDEAIESQEFPE
jgi:hypothetical protein